MSGKFYLHCLLLFHALLLTACEKEPQVEMPPPQTLTQEANGYYCLMTVAYHDGPKGHIILTDNKVHWFASIRDTISFTLSPEEPRNIAAIYVNDMSNASWENPGDDNWIDARKAWYVIASNRAGGMGSAEAVPFLTKAKAEEFTLKYGGIIKTFDTIPKNYILKPQIK
ncbi:MAG: nitrous oxide reductase accessory protein NosL [Gammaproteobacteria bacterium]|nr:nitrous oxide reductase accessory protein NosL [Gammaproteobacteria bacterium]